MSGIHYRHKMAAHCETGTIAGLLDYNGLSITEPMVFGLANGIFFGYIKMPNFNFPMFFVRSKPGNIRTTIAKRLGIKFCTKNYYNPDDAQQDLDRLLEKNIPAAVQVDFFYMNYLQPWLRVHNNAHYIVIISKEEEKYLVSDCYYPEVAKIDADILGKARFAGGIGAPKGLMFYPTFVPKKIDYRKYIIIGIKKAAFNMIKIPIPFLGIKGIRRFAKKINEWPKLARDIDHLSHEIMKINILLEDQGTGGAGFSFMYATFLRQASEILNDRNLFDFSKRMMEIGDGWREVSLCAIRMGKNRDFSEAKFKELSNLIMSRAEAEKQFFTDIYSFIKKYVRGIHFEK
ncbi:MAG: BtrH N-terminal domain-containing protein [Bacteroidia bacterium]|nr:BtrH N-terminal domain-containing protein [Bacteroidia bacterium]